MLTGSDKKSGVAIGTLFRPTETLCQKDFEPGALIYCQITADILHACV